ncbi:AI-2E family transporter [Apilactobacillus xinyiensis]|uniref:AI-2E family transporter n=1 Tax=Apilactobacillus xinyiensis TaxID=2841032 RepID=A0ABT0I303_9LACO|nr:AI-2E family transporter [Apilactobacillus xinyiensis]MCK8625079.1 AI-2E family transporter [Apilactobacillus xinyiensis]MCL0312760.1 AI-2E family transporter [Apilactobacillus xinyiensis]MCL0318891.1 AI-2E family transporter [Apilactobacillus xinyiensis]MCL0330753.1 AI-2E family transporter [Apilactobacillus xinyiensis]
MDIWQKFLNNVKVRRYVVLIFIVCFLFLIRGMLSMILLTFILTFLTTKWVKFVHKRIKIPAPILVILTYLIFIVAIVVLVTVYLPVIADQAVIGTKHIINFYQDPSNLIGNDNAKQIVQQFVEKSNFLNTLKGSLNIVWSYVTSVGQMGVTLFISIILSFFFTLEEKQLADFSKNFLNADFSWFFSDIYYFAQTFTKTFGVVLEAQFIIAALNTVFTTIIMYVLGMPQLGILAVLVFFLSLIPVAGVIISLIPLCLIGYSVGGFKYIIYLVIMITVVHFFEAYVLNPKLMSSRTDLPIFFTFCALLIGEETLGVWGLIVSVPILTFVLEIIGVRRIPKKEKNEIQS